MGGELREDSKKNGPCFSNGIEVKRNEEFRTYLRFGNMKVAGEFRMGGSGRNLFGVEDGMMW